MPKKDINQLAHHIVALVTGEIQPEKSTKNPAAVALGRLGGLKGGKTRAENMTPERRKEIAQKAAKKRWGKI